MSRPNFGMCIGNRVSNLRHIMSANNMVSLRNFKKLLWLSKYDVSDRPPLKLQLLMSPQRGGMVISMRPMLRLGLTLSHFCPFLPEYTSFLHIFGVVGQIFKMNFLSGCTWYLQIKKLRTENIKWSNEE